MREVTYGAALEILGEARRAADIHGEFHSTHEGYAVLLEEVDELWDAIKDNDLDNAIEEATQVGAMALRMLVCVSSLKAARDASTSFARSTG